MSGMWKRSHGRTSEAPPDERGGYRYVRPTATAPHLDSTHARADEALLALIKTVHISSRQTYGAPRVHAELRAAGERHGRKRIARLMRVAGLIGASRRRGGPITTQRNKQARPAPDLVERDFQAAGPNQLWVADITPAFAGAGLYGALFCQA